MESSAPTGSPAAPEPPPDLPPSPAPDRRVWVPDRVLIGLTAVLALALLIAVAVSLLVWHQPAPTPVDVPSVSQA